LPSDPSPDLSHAPRVGPSHAEILLGRVRSEGCVFDVGDGSLGIFDPALLLKVDSANADNLRVTGSFLDMLRGRSSDRAMPWKQVRTLLIERSRRLNHPRHLEPLHRRMAEHIAAGVGRPVDLTRLVVEATTRSLIPLVISGLQPGARAKVVADLDAKFRRLAAPAGAGVPLRLRLSDLFGEISAGRAVEKGLKRRLRSGGEADDFAASILPLAPRIGIARCAYLVSTLITAISGAPGSTAACLLFELLRSPEWRERIRAEFEALEAGELASAPAAKLPATMRFLRETMRLWAFPLITRRVVDRDLEVEGVCVAAGGSFDLSSYVMHHNDAHWPDPERFDPDRWVSAKPPRGGTYAPFGFGPRTCVGASLGQSQLILFLELVCCRFDFALDDPDATHIGLDGVALPRALTGTVSARGR
jgi:cytochrome P450